MRFTTVAALLSVVLYLCGCAEPVVFSEVLQQQKDQKIYTRYNLWYTDPQNMSCLNIQQGSFIPAGTEIEPVGTSWWSDSITFKVVSTGTEHVIKFDSDYRLCSMREFIAYTFGTDDLQSMLKNQSDAAKLRIRRGEITPGMDVNAVMMAYGPPPKCRTSDFKNASWIYWRSPTETFRVVFRNDKVNLILNTGLDN